MKLYAKQQDLSIEARLPWRLLLLSAMLLAMLLAGCGGATAPPKPTLESEDPGNVLWAHGSKALRLSLSAAKDLNSYESKAHSLQLCVYQLDKRDAFDPLAGTQDGVDTLLQCAPFDKSVKSTSRIFVQPGENAVHTLDRAEGALFVGIVCGYFESSPEQSVKLWEIPPKITQSGHLFWKSTIYSAGSLDLSLNLSAHAMEEDSEKEEAKAQGEKK